MPFDDLTLTTGALHRFFVEPGAPSLSHVLLRRLQIEINSRAQHDHDGEDLPPYWRSFSAAVLEAFDDLKDLADHLARMHELRSFELCYKKDCMQTPHITDRRWSQKLRAIILLLAKTPQSFTVDRLVPDVELFDRLFVLASPRPFPFTAPHLSPACQFLYWKIPPSQ